MELRRSNDEHGVAMDAAPSRSAAYSARKAPSPKNGPGERGRGRAGQPKGLTQGSAQKKNVPAKQAQKASPEPKSPGVQGKAHSASAMLVAPAPTVVTPAPLLPSIAGFFSSLTQPPSGEAERHLIAGVKSVEKQGVDDGEHEPKTEEKNGPVSDLAAARSVGETSQPAALLPPKRFRVPEAILDAQEKKPKGWNAFQKETRPRSWNDFLLKLAKSKRLLWEDDDGNILPLSGHRLGLLRKEFGNEVDPKSELPLFATLLRRLGSNVSLYSDLIGTKRGDGNIIPLSAARRRKKLGQEEPKPLFKFQMNEALHHFFGDRASLYPRSEAARVDAPSAYNQLLLRVVSALQKNSWGADSREKTFAGQLLNAMLGELDENSLGLVVGAMTDPRGSEFERGILHLFNVSAMGINGEEMSSLYGISSQKTNNLLGYARDFLQTQLRGVARKSFEQFELGTNLKILLKPEVRAKILKDDQWLNAQQLRSHARKAASPGFSNPDYFGEHFKSLKMYRIQPDGSLQWMRTFSADQYNALVKFARDGAQARSDTKGSTVKILLGLLGPLGEVVALGAVDGPGNRLVSLGNMFRAAFGNESKLLDLLDGFLQKVGMRGRTGTSPEFERHLSNAMESGSRSMRMTTDDFINGVVKQLNSNLLQNNSVNQVKAGFHRQSTREAMDAMNLATASSTSELKAIFKDETVVDKSLEMLKAYDSTLYRLLIEFEKNPTRKRKLELADAIDVSEASIINKLRVALDTVKEFIEQQAGRSGYQKISHAMEKKILAAATLSELKVAIGLPKDELERLLGSKQSLELRELETRYNAAIEALDNDKNMKQNLEALIAYDEARSRGETPSLSQNAWEAFHFIQQKLTEPG